MRLVKYRGKWAAAYAEDGRTVRRSLGTADRLEAERRLADFRRAAPGETAGQAVAYYLTEKHKTARSYEAMFYAWRALEPHFAHLRPDQITPAACRTYAAFRRGQGRTDGTIIKELGFLRTALAWAKKPAAGIVLPPAPDPRDRHLTREEFERLLAACAAPHLRLFVILALSTGGRAGALLDLTWDRIDFGRGRIALGIGGERRKGRATVPMTERARAALKEAYEGRTSAHVIEWAGRPVGSVKRAFREAARKAGIEDATPHVLRHTCAVWQAEAGVPMSEIAQFLGHSDSRITERVYAKYSPEHLRRGAKALD